MFKFVREWFSRLFPAPAAPAPITVVSPFKSFEYTVLHAYSNAVVGAGTATARSEADAINSIYAMHGERIQFIGGGRYRVHNDVTKTVTRIDRSNRRKAGDRAKHRMSITEVGGIVGE